MTARMRGMTMNYYDEMGNEYSRAWLERHITPNIKYYTDRVEGMFGVITDYQLTTDSIAAAKSRIFQARMARKEAYLTLHSEE